METKTTLRATLLAALILISFNFLMAQDQGFIYGKVTTIDNRVYEGALRWGKEEVFWTDLFNTAKLENDNLDFLSRDERRALEDRYHERYHDRHHSWFEAFISHDIMNEDYDYTHQFVCQFGELKSIRPYGRERVEVVLQNGDKYELSGDGYNDIGTDVKIMDPEIGEVELNWSRIEFVEFMNGPKTFKDKFGKPIYGTVETYGGTFTGTIQWDHDERVTTDKLDGDTRDGDVSISFGNIAAIERQGRSSSLVTLKSGREMELDGSNDVDDGNRGVVVTTTFGRVDIPWKEFKKVSFTEKQPFTLLDYDDFKSQKMLEGKVLLANGKSQDGSIVFDLDETKEYEVLQGADKDIKYVIPFRNIKRIIPKNYDYSTIELKDGTSFLLGEEQDVSDKNTGVIVRRGSEHAYSFWEDIKEIAFR